MSKCYCSLIAWRYLTTSEHIANLFSSSSIQLATSITIVDIIYCDRRVQSDCPQIYRAKSCCAHLRDCKMFPFQGISNIGATTGATCAIATNIPSGGPRLRLRGLMLASVLQSDVKLACQNCTHVDCNIECICPARPSCVTFFGLTKFNTF